MVATNEFIERHLARRTIRHYDPARTITQEQLNYLFTAAQCSPSASGAGSWSAITLTTRKEKQRFMQAAGMSLDNTDQRNKKCFEDCSVFIIWVLDNYKIERAIKLVAQGFVDDDIKNILESRLVAGAETARPSPNAQGELFTAQPHVDLLDQNYYTVRALTDCVIAAQTFVMCAESLGMATMYMGSIAQCNISSFKNELNLPDRTFPMFGMCVGYEHPGGSDHNGIAQPQYVLNLFKQRPDLKIKPVLPLEAVVYPGEYNTENIDQYLREFNQTLWEYSKTANPIRPSDYLACRVTARTKRVPDQFKLMRDMGNKLL
jgi:nitroreductase